MALTKAQRARIERYDRDNRESALIILADTGKYGGEGSGAVLWAHAVRSKYPLKKGNGRESISRPPSLVGLR